MTGDPTTPPGLRRFTSAVRPSSCSHGDRHTVPPILIPNAATRGSGGRDGVRTQGPGERSCAVSAAPFEPERALSQRPGTPRPVVRQHRPCARAEGKAQAAYLRFYLDTGEGRADRLAPHHRVRAATREPATARSIPQLRSSKRSKKRGSMAIPGFKGRHSRARHVCRVTRRKKATTNA